MKMIPAGPIRPIGIPGEPVPAYPHQSVFTVITLGSGTPEPNPARAGACTAIQYEGRYYVVDTGNGSSVVS